MHIPSIFYLGQPSITPSLPSPMQNPSSTPLNDAHQRFCTKLDQLSQINVCSICSESYPGISTKTFYGAYACSRCILERKGHRFSLENNMDPGIQPPILAILTQVEEMLIFHVDPIL